jgi:hypothetical protein
MTSTKRSAMSPLTVKLAGILGLAAVSFGGSGIASARAVNARRGDVVTRGPAAKMVAAGPIALHAYSQFGGGALYAVPAVTGTDRDCQGPVPGATPIEADRIEIFAVGENQVACLATTTNGSFELMWHAVSQPAPSATVLAKAGR